MPTPVYTCTHCGQEHDQHPDRCNGCGGKTVGPYTKDDRKVDIEQRKSVRR